MNDLSPVIQIVRDFGAPYGAIAVGTVSVLFAVSAGISYNVVKLMPWKGRSQQT